MRLSLTILFALAVVCRAQETATGRWEGVIQIPDRELRAIVDLAPGQTGGPWIGSIIIPGLNIEGGQLSSIDVKNETVSFAFKTGGSLSIDATFKARFTSDNAMAGDFVQAGNSAPFLLKKIGPAQVELPTKSTAIAKECEGEWKGEYELMGYARKVTLKLANHGADGATADFVIVGRKTNVLPVDLITQGDGFLTVDSHETGISYEGRFNKQTSEIKGTLLQGPVEVALTLHR